MPSRSVKDFTSDITEIKNTFYELCPKNLLNSDLVKIFNIAIEIDLRLFPTKILSNDSDNLRGYFEKWINGYTSFVLPSKRERSKKGTCDDPAIQQMIKILCRYSDSEVKMQSAVHDLFMSAENAQGNLLEEYIAEKSKPFGWIWCIGETLRSVDFCSYDGNYLLQIKNKNNTENSSSSSIRLGTSVR